MQLALASRCAFSCVWASRLAKPRLLTQNASQNAPSETGKQHGLASSRTRFLDLRWCDLQCQTLRPEPIKKRGFCSLTPFFDLRWCDLQCQTLRPEPMKKRGFCSLTPFFDLRWCDLHSMSNVASRTYKKIRFCRIIGFEMRLQLRLGVTPGKATASHPKCFPKRALRNGETAWPGQRNEAGFSAARRKFTELRHSKH